MHSDFATAAREWMDYLRCSVVGFPQLTITDSRDRKRRSGRILTRAVLSGVLATGACSRGATDETEGRSEAEPAGVVVEGSVVLADEQPLPSYEPWQMDRRVLRDVDPDPVSGDCAQALERARQPVRIERRRGLSNVIVAATGFEGGRQPKSQTRTVRIEGCALAPVTLVAARGDRLSVVNASARSYDIVLGVEGTVRSLEPGERTDVVLRDAGVQVISCSHANPCGRADVAVFHHRLATVTDAEGTFRIAGLPEGELVNLHAWHPLFDQTQWGLWADRRSLRRPQLRLRPKTAEAVTQPP